MKLFVKYENCDNGKQISKRSSIGPSYRKLLYDVLLRVEFKNVLEIGCYRGYSSVAFLQALDDGAGFRYTIADPRPDMLTLTTLVERCDHRDKVKIRRKKSIDVIDKHFDFIFVDGNHTAEGIGPELLRILECQTKTLMAHDVWIDNPEHPEYGGAHLYRHVFSNHRQYHYVDDREVRKDDPYEGCGIAFMSREMSHFELVVPLFDAIRCEGASTMCNDEQNFSLP